MRVYEFTITDKNNLPFVEIDEMAKGVVDEMIEDIWDEGVYTYVISAPNLKAVPMVYYVVVYSVDDNG